MGNRAVIVSKDTTKENKNQKLGIYVHWNGGEEDVKSFLQEAKEKGVRDVISDPSYGWARLAQVIGDNFTKWSLESEYETAKAHAYETSLGIGIVKDLDCHNYDNGVYYIDENWEIVKHTSGEELEENQDSDSKGYEVIDTWVDENEDPVVEVHHIKANETDWYGIYDIQDKEYIGDLHQDRDLAEQQAEQYRDFTYGNLGEEVEDIQY